MAGHGPVPQDLRIADSPRQAIENAEVICTAATPDPAGHDLRPEVHINAVGSFTPRMQQIDSDTLLRARVVVDSRQAAMAESGDLIIPIEAGIYDRQSIHAELGELVNHSADGRTSPDQISLFKSVGLAIQDAAAASVALAHAEQHDIGQLIDL